jgi:hypothetical protein
MSGLKDGKLRLDAAKLIASYPPHSALPAVMKKHFDSLNAPIIKENKEIDEWNKTHPGDQRKKKGLNTPCCFQVSWALNAVGGEHRVPSASHRRGNTALDGGYHMGAVDELEVYLTEAYGAPEVVKTPKRNTRKAMEQYLAGRQGVIAYREGYAGAHTEIWDKTRVLQNGAPIANNQSGTAMMNLDWIWGRPIVLFWEILAPKPSFVAPAWLVGWWQITDFPNSYYYYFYPDGTVVYSKTAPGMAYCPVPSVDNSGNYSLKSANTIRIKWNDEDYNAELFGFVAAKEVSAMAGTYEGIAALPFAAMKMSFRRW